MKKWYIKYKILINGFSVKEKYEDDGFVLKTGKFDKERISEKYDESLNGVDIDLYRLLFESCSCNYKDLSYRYLESNCLKEIEVSNKINKNNYYMLIEKNQDIIENVRDYQKKMRIRFNVPVLLSSSLFFSSDSVNSIESFAWDSSIAGKLFRTSAASHRESF